MSFRNNVVTKKLVRYVNNTIRPIRLKNTSSSQYLSQPPVLVNSFPKSGTHLLHQIISSIPQLIDYGNFIASMPSFTFKEVSANKINQRLGQILPNEIVASHIHFNEQYSSMLQEKNIFKLFIYRDLRDVTISEAHYLSTMNKWHKLSGHFSKIDSMEDRIKLSLRGLPASSGIDYPNVVKRFMKYKGWLNSPDTLLIRFEDLVSKDGEKYLRLIAEEYLKQCGEVSPFNGDELVSLFKQAIDPEKSHTFRSGKKEQWKQVYTDAMKEQYQEYLQASFTTEEIDRFQLH